MKHAVLTLALVALIAAAAGVVAFRTTGDPAVEQALEQHDAMAWLRADFNLTAAQFATIKKLHDSYSVVCEQHCRAIQEATRERNKLAASNASPAAIAAAERRVAELRLVCESAIAAHVRQCAAEMSPEAGRRYLALVLPKIEDFDHQAPPDLQLNRHAH